MLASTPLALIWMPPGANPSGEEAGHQSIYRRHGASQTFVQRPAYAPVPLEGAGYQARQVTPGHGRESTSWSEQPGPLRPCGTPEPTIRRRDDGNPGRAPGLPDA